jgi:GTPase SAR1 family protein
VKVWLKEIENNGNPNSLIVLLGNKTDLEDKRDINLNVKYISELENFRRPCSWRRVIKSKGMM